MRHSLLFAALAAVSLPVVLTAAETKSPRDASSGMASGKVSIQDLHFTSHADADSHCAGAQVTQSGSSFTCAAPADSKMAITEQGLPKKQPPK